MRLASLIDLPIHAKLFWSAFALWVLPELVWGKVKRSTDTSRARDRGSLTLIAVLWTIGILMAFLLARYAPRAAITWERSTILLIGIFLMLVGIAIRWYSVAVLGKYFTFDVAVRNDHRLIETGPYRYVRHPSYSGALITLAGFGLALGNWAALVACVSCLSAAYAYRIPLEESALIAALGEPYRQYMGRTGRLVPFVF